ncbi:MAG: S16 family serine protease, partial [Myxococcota bacterium]
GDHGQPVDLSHSAALGQHVTKAIHDGKRRADLPGRRYRDRIASGMLHVQTQGRRVGQVNGLAVVSAGALAYGFPLRITASVGPGSEGAIHLQREAMMSGQIHTKGFLTVQGLLRNFLVAPHPLTFDASITHEQSYGGVDGDSASGAEFVCLMSAITGWAAHQGLAMTGAVDQHGHVLPVGAVDEKIEGFFDACAAQGLDGHQGVLIPGVAAGALQLRSDVVQACREGRFAIYAIDEIAQALELILGQDVDAIRSKATAQLADMWQASSP